MNPIITLIKREWWECRSNFLYLPMAIGLLLVGLAIIALIALSISDIDMQTTNWQAYFDASAIISYLFDVAQIFIVILWLIVFYYFLGALFNDRKDGSVLFWQSMPVSQAQILFSKLIAGLFIAPILFWLCLVITEMLLLLFAAVGINLLNLPVAQILWHPGLVILTWLNCLLVILTQSLWLFPFAGWLLFCSAFARRSPFLLAVIPPIIMVLVETMVGGGRYIGTFIADRFRFAGETSRYFYEKVNDWFGVLSGQTEHADKFLKIFMPTVTITFYDVWLHLVVGLVIGLLFVSIAGFLRNRSLWI